MQSSNLSIQSNYMSFCKMTWGTTLKAKEWCFMSPWGAGTSPSEQSHKVNSIRLNSSEAYQTPISVCPFLCQWMACSSSACLTEIFLILILKSSFSVLTDLTWQTETSLSKWGIGAKKALPEIWICQHPPDPCTSPAFIPPFPLHLCQSFLVLCISTISPQRRGILQTREVFMLQQLMAAWAGTPGCPCEGTRWKKRMREIRSRPGWGTVLAIEWGALVVPQRIPDYKITEKVELEGTQRDH